MPMSSNIGTGQNAPRANGRRSAQKYFEDITDKLLAAIFDKFKEHCLRLSACGKATPRTQSLSGLRNILRAKT
jgi:hypothetical protein